MALPAEVRTVTLTGTYQDLTTGVPIAGSIRFEAQVPAVLDTTSNVVLVPLVVEAAFDTSGHFSVVLPATDTPQLQPVSGWAYKVTEKFASGRIFMIYLPYANGSTQDISRVSPIAGYTPIATGPTGATGRGFNPRGTWAAGATYLVDDIVTANGATWRCNTAHTSGAAWTASSYWDEWARGLNFRGNWAATTPYLVDDVVLGPDGTSYRCVTVHTSGATFSTTNWVVLALAGTNGINGAPATATALGTVQLTPTGDIVGSATNLQIANKGQPNGIPTLDSTGKIPSAQIPGGSGSDQGSVTVDTVSTPGSVIATISGNWGLTDPLSNLVTDPHATGVGGQPTGVQWSAYSGSGGAGSIAFQPSGAPDTGPFARYTQTTAATGTGGPFHRLRDGGGLPNQVYSASVWVRSSVAATLTPAIEFHDSSNAFLAAGNGTPVALAANTWTQVTAVAQRSPAGTAQLTLTLYGTLVQTLNATLDFTELQVEPLDSVHDYFDGSHNGGAWAGAANASLSTKQAQVYYDTAGAVPSEAGLLVPDPDGSGFSIFRPGGTWISEDQRVASFVLDPTSRLYAALAPFIATGRRLIANPQAGASYTLAMTDLGGLVMSTAGTATTVTVPPNSSVPFPVGGVIEFLQAGAGQLALAAGAGVVINSPSGSLAVRVQNGRLRLVKTATDTWSLAGDLTDYLADQASRPMLKVRRLATAFSVPTNLFAAIPWDTLDFDTAGGSYTAASTTVRISRSGYYLVQAGVDVAATTTGRKALRTFANRAGTDVALNVGQLIPSGSVGDSSAQASGIAYLQAGDLVRVEAYQDSGAAQNTGCPDFSPTHLSLTWMRY